MCKKHWVEVVPVLSAMVLLKLQEIDTISSVLIITIIMIPEEVGHGHVTGEFIWRFTILKCVLGSLYKYLNKLDIVRKL